MTKGLILRLASGLPLLFPLSGLAQALTPQEAVYSLAQRCVVVQSPGTGKMVSRYTDLLGITRYRFDTRDLAEASRFYMKPSALGDFLMTDRGGRFLSSRVPALEIATGEPEAGSEWRISAAAAGSGFRYSLKNLGTDSYLQNAYLDFLQLTTERQFNLLDRPASECTKFPEIELNAQAPGYANPLDALKSPAYGIRGFIDGHTHLTAEEFVGGVGIAGHAFHRWGVARALKDCRDIHGEDGKQDKLGKVAGGYTSHNTAGWPQFTDWPAADKAVSHTGYYYRWVERAHLAGMRLMVVYAVENEVLCDLGKAINLATGQPLGKSCDTLDSVRRQVDDLYALQNYVDAQSGGPGKGFFRIVLDPAEARRVIADGKLAVVIGIEASETFHCSGKDLFCTADGLLKRLDTYKAMGVRSIFPVHKFDTQLGGATLHTPSLTVMNAGSTLDNWHPFEIEACDKDTLGATLPIGARGFDPATFVPGYDNLGPVVKALVDTTANTAESLGGSLGLVYDPEVANGNACNRRGLSALGRVVVNGMMDRKLLIDVDHEGTRMTSDVLDIAERRPVPYSGIVGSHGDTEHDRNDPQGTPHYNYVRLARLGGHISALARNTQSFPSLAIPGYVALRDAAAASNGAYLAGIGIGTDYNGLIRMPLVQSGDEARNAVSRVTYPFTSEFGVTFDRQVSGNRAFDINDDGLAHYGLLPDLMQSYSQWMRHPGQNPVEVGPDGAKKKIYERDLYESMMNSAESYLQMWERASR